MKTITSSFAIFCLTLIILLTQADLAKAQNGLAFNGSSQYVTFGKATGLGSATFTLECWFRKQGAGVGTSTGTGGVTNAIPLIAKGRGEEDGTTKDMNYFLGINTANNLLAADFEEITPGPSPGLNHPVFGVTRICNNVWYHAAATYDGTTWKLYLNGNLEATLAVNRSPQSGSIQHASIASALTSTGAAAGFFNGRMDEVRIWNYARTRTDIQNNLGTEITSASGLLGRWGLNHTSGTVAANSGSAGTAVNGALKNTPTWVNGTIFTPLTVNSSLSFGGTNAYVTFGNNAALRLPLFTLECWFRREGTGVSASSGSGGVTAYPLITKGRSEGDGNTTDMNYFLGINSSSNVLCADFEEGTGQPSPGLNHPVNGVTAILNNVWYHAAATYDGATWKLYLNGNLESSLAVNRAPQSASIQHAGLGTALNSLGTAAGFFYGSIDEARIWNSAKSQTEIQNNINSQIISSQSGLVALWGMSDNCGATLTGIDATAINGTIKGNNWNWNSAAPFNIGFSCNVPTTLSASSVTSSSATLNWNAIGAATSYNIQYRIVGAASWIPTSSLTNSISLSTLTSASNYEWQVQTVCPLGSTGFSSVSTFTTSSPCAVATNFSSTAITSSSALLSWTAPIGGTGYNIQYRIVGNANWSTTTSASTSVTVSNLLSSSNYEWQVQSNCGAEVSAWSSSQLFTTSANTNTNFTDSLVTSNAVWKYLDNGTNQGAAWTASAFNDASWASGAAELGYGDGDETTVLSYGGNANAKYITTYFRKTFSVTNPAAYNFLKLQVRRDDGAVVYINGTEVFRTNMPTGAVTYTTLASAATPDETTFFSADLNPSSLLTGNNVIAVEIHQNAATSSDISFKLKLVGGYNSNTTLIRGPYLNMVSSSGIVVRWKTDIATDSKVSYGTVAGTLTSSTVNSTVTTEHIVQLSGLSPATKYYYSIGSSAAVSQGDANNYFQTAPVTGTSAPVRIWGLGDFGSGLSQQDAVRDAYAAYSGSANTNLWIWLGDNAYQTGTDNEFQTKVFNEYPNQFKNIPVMPSPGNHDYGQSGYQSSSAMTTNWAYYSIFSMPTAGECGGVASGTEKYYSYNYGNIHLISLDSYGALNNSGSPMYTWLQNDLAANTQRWTIVYFHHPPYTMGAHNSDTDAESKNMRQNIIPLLEQYHVDLVLNGHSHCNERSYLIKGHYGLASTFTSAMKISTATNSFTKSPPYDGTIYAVCGSGGQPEEGTQTGWPMPCMFYSNTKFNCSLVLDINGDNLSCKYLTSTGTIADQFTITKTGSARLSEEENDDFNFTIKPNPTDNYFTVGYKLSEESTVTIKLMDITGKIILGSEHSTQQNAGSNEFNFNRNELHLSNGIYLVSLSVNGKEYLKKVVVE